MSKEKELYKIITEIKPYKLTKRQKLYVGLKVIMDFMIALVGLIFCIIPFILIGIAIKLDSKGPVFFKHKRIGKNGKEFMFIKFRSMSVEARPDVAGYDYAEVNSYITKVGRFLRKTSLDELPQLFSLLTGKMSLIGYRPSQKSEKELNDEREYLNIHQIRPGITGWAQVNGRDILAANPTLKAKYDGYYLSKISIFLDIKIFFMTIKKVLFNKDIKDGKIENNERNNS